MSTGTAPTKSKQLSREEAIKYLNTLPYLVASSRCKLLPEMVKKHGHRRVQNLEKGKPSIHSIPFTLTLGSRSYTFSEQPFRIVRQITEEEYLRILPLGSRAAYYYEIHTD